MPVPGVEVTDETGKLPPYVSTVLSFAVARIETVVETVTATQPDSALQSFCRTQLAHLSRGAGSFAAEGLN